MPAPNTFACVECGLSVDAKGFVFHAGERAQGPAYWSDRGLLCSAPCAQAHARRRAAEGTSMTEPADDPLEAATRA